MTTSAQELLELFDRLPESQQLDIALEIFKRILHLDFPPLTDEELAFNAEEIFLELDRQEAAYE